MENDIRIVFSPDDGGYYAVKGFGASSVTTKTYATEAALRRAIESGKVRWKR